MSRAFASRVRSHLSSLSIVAVLGAAGALGAAACDVTEPDPAEPAEVSELDRAVDAMGGPDALRAVTNERIAAHGERYFPLQGASYGQPRHLATFDYVRTAEYGADRLHEIKRRYPTKPIRYVVVSHFHNDHSGGLRNFVADGGVTVLVGAPSAPFYEQVLANPHTLVADQLAKQPVPVALDPVAEREVLASAGAGAGHEIQVHRVKTTHANDMLIAYLPAEKLLFTADLFNPNMAGPGTSIPFENPKFVAMAGELFDEIRRLGLDVERIAGAHGGGTVTFEQLRAGAGR